MPHACRAAKEQLPAATKVIVSSHDYEQTASEEELRELVEVRCAALGTAALRCEHDAFLPAGPPPACLLGSRLRAAPPPACSPVRPPACPLYCLQRCHAAGADIAKFATMANDITGGWVGACC